MLEINIENLGKQLFYEGWFNLFFFSFFSQIFLEINSNNLKRFPFHLKQLSADLYIFQLSYRLYMKRGEKIRITAQCLNKTVGIQKNSRLEISILGKREIKESTFFHFFFCIWNIFLIIRN